VRRGRNPRDRLSASGRQPWSGSDPPADAAPEARR
jgi:hypothetical protein